MTLKGILMPLRVLMGECLPCIGFTDADRGILNKKCLKLHREDPIYKLQRRGRRLQGSQNCFVLSLDKLIYFSFFSYLFEHTRFL